MLVKRYLSNPVTHAVEPVKADAAAMEHHVLAVDKEHKPDVVRALAGGQGRSLLFMRTKHTAKKLAKQLTAAGIPAVDLHGNLSQNARERNLAAFSDGSVKVLVATDIAARGIHVDDINLVVHVDPPAEHKAYTHRSGRTARAGAAGVVVTIMTPDQHGDVRTLTRQAGIRPQQAVVVPGDALLSELAGPAAAYVEPVAVPLRPRTGAAQGFCAVLATRAGPQRWWPVAGRPLRRAGRQWRRAASGGQVAGSGHAQQPERCGRRSGRGRWRTSPPSAVRALSRSCHAGGAQVDLTPRYSQRPPSRTNRLRSAARSRAARHPGSGPSNSTSPVASRNPPPRTSCTSRRTQRSSSSSASSAGRVDGCHGASR